MAVVAFFAPSFFDSLPPPPPPPEERDGPDADDRVDVLFDDSLDGADGRADPSPGPEARSEADETVRGPGAAGVATGRASPMEGGAPPAADEGREVPGTGVLGLGFSLSHESKKSSSPPTGVLAPASGVSSSPSMWIPFGFLSDQHFPHPGPLVSILFRSRF